jgi:hypothetical protein
MGCQFSPESLRASTRSVLVANAARKEGLVCATPARLRHLKGVLTRDQGLSQS